MITKERLAEIEAAPREASIFKAEAKELADAYRERAPVTAVTSDEEYRLRIAHLRATIEQAARYARNRLSTTHEVDREDWAADLTAIAEMLEGRLRT